MSDDVIVLPKQAGDNFSFKKVEANERLTVPNNQQMIVYDGMEVLGEMVLIGEVLFL